MPLAPLAIDPQYRHDPYRPFTGFEGLPSMGGGATDAIAQMMLQMFGGQMMGARGMLPMGMTDQNMYDRFESYRLQQMHDRFLSEAAQQDQQTYFEGLRGFARLMGTPFQRPQIEAAEELSSLMAAAGPAMIQSLPPSVIDSLGGMRGMNVAMAEHMFRGGRFRIDPLTGQTGLGEESLTRLNQDVYEQMFAGDAWRRGAGLSAGDVGELFHEMQRMGMARGPARMSGLGQDVLLDAAVSAGIDLGMGPGFDPRLAGGGVDFDIGKLAPDQVRKIRDAPEVSDALVSLDSTRVVRSLEDYSGVVKAMREIFGDAGNPNAPLPALINALNQLTGGALPQLDPGEVEGMVRMTHNLSRSTGIGLEGAMMMSQAAVQQAQAMGLPPIFASDTLQHSLAFRGAFQGLGLGAHPAWGLSGIEAQTMADMQLTTAAAQSTAANQIGTAMRMRDTLGAGDSSAFREGSAAAAYIAAVEAGSPVFRDPTTGDMRSIQMQREEFIDLMQQGSRAPMGRETVDRLLSQRETNMEFGQRYGAAGTVRRAQRPEFMSLIATDIAFNAQERIAGMGLGLAGDQEDVIGQQVATAATESLFGMSAEQRTDRQTRNRIMSRDIQARLEAAAAGDIPGVDPAAAQQVLRRMRRGGLGAAMAEELYGASEAASRELHMFGSPTLQDALQLFDPEALNQADRNIARERARGMAQEALSPLGRSGAMRRAVQAVMDAGPDDDLIDIFAETLGGVDRAHVSDAFGGDDGPLAKLRDRRKRFEELSKQYEQADTAEARAAILQPLRAAQQGYQEAIAGVGNVARRGGIQFGALVEADDLSRATLATDFVKRVLSEDDADPARLRRALATERQYQDDIVAMMYADPTTMTRLGDAGLTQLGKLEAGHRTLDELAVLHAGGDMGRLMRGELDEGLNVPETLRVLSRRDLARRDIGRSMTYLQDTHRGGPDDYAYLTNREKLGGLLGGVAGIEGYEYVGNLGDLVTLRDADLVDLQKRGAITAADVGMIKGAREEFTDMQERVAQRRADYRKSGREIMVEGVAALTGRDVADIGDADLAEVFGRDNVQALQAELGKTGIMDRRRKHAFAALMRDKDALSRHADDADIGFEDGKFIGDPLALYRSLRVTDPPAGEEEEQQEVIIRLDVGRLEISRDAAEQLQVQGEGVMEGGRR